MLATKINTAQNKSSPKLLAPKRFGYWTSSLPVVAILWAAVLISIEKNPAASFVQNMPLVLLGLVASILANISAIGGGIVGIPVMIFMYHFPPVIALKATLGTQAFGLTAGAISWWKAGFVPARGLKCAVPGLLLGSTISSLIIHADAFLIKSLFGPVSIVLGILALISLKHSSENSREDIPEKAQLPLFFASILGGLVTGWVSIGEGEIIAALLMLRFGVSAKRSIALGVVLLALNSIYLTVVHLLFLGGIPWHISMYIILGTFFGSRLAPYIAQWLNVRMLKIVFASIAIFDGMIFIYQCVQHNALK